MPESQYIGLEAETEPRIAPPRSKVQENVLFASYNTSDESSEIWKGSKRRRGLSTVIPDEVPRHPNGNVKMIIGSEYSYPSTTPDTLTDGELTRLSEGEVSALLQLSTSVFSAMFAY